MTDDTVTASPRRRPRLLWAAIALSAAIAVGTGAYLAFRPTGLAATDPAGAKACNQLSEWITGDLRDPDTKKPASKGLAAVALGDIAKDATTPAIRGAAGEDLMGGDAGTLVKAHGGPAGLRFANLPDLHAACVSAGVKMPPYAEPAA